jgi:tRNA threonylcarbamoyladenosine biosynthesis protein TsaB
MNVLALDTSSDCSVVAVSADGRVTEDNGARAGDSRHGDVLLPRIEAQLKSAGLTLGQLQLIAVGLGPGSFTGLRVGLATAKGLALATGLPLRGVSSVEVLARAVFELALPAPERVAVVIDAGRGELYSAGYERRGAELACVLPGERALVEPALARLATALPRSGALALCGTGLRSHGAALRAALGDEPRFAEPAFDVPAGRQLADAARAALLAQGPSDLAALEPLYLRDSDAKLPAEPLAT